ncbi:MAG: hypothetical protein U5L96_12725 [Owenweeksia sp.]|nr:hypothetical protein [Owenweeksia sp.]
MPFTIWDPYSNPLPYYSSIGKLFQQNVPGALVDAQDAYAIHPYNIIVLNQLGNVYKKMGQMEKALEYYQLAIGISNLFESARLSVAEIYLQQNKPVDALEALALVRRSSRNQKYLQLLSQALPLTVQTYAEHQRFGPLVRYLRQRKPRSRQEYVQYFLEFRLTESNG